LISIIVKIIDSHYYRNTVPMSAKNTVTGLLTLLIVGAFVYLVDPTLFGLLKRRQLSGFQGAMQRAVSLGNAAPGQMANPGPVNVGRDFGNPGASGNVPGEGFGDLGNFEGPAEFGSAGAPAGCYPRDQLTPSELLPKDQNSVWAEQNPMGPGSLKGKNFLSAGALIGVNTVGQSLRNANYQLRSEPPNPQVPVSIFNQSTIQPDVNRRPLEIS
jgi:hypothetical protein